MGGKGCTVSGAVGALVAETVCDFIKPDALDIDQIYQENKNLSEEEVKDLFLQKAITYRDESQIAEKISKISAAIIPAIGGMNVGVAAATGANAIDNNALPTMVLGAYIIGTVGYIGYQTYTAYHDKGTLAALKTLGIEVLYEGGLILTGVAAAKAIPIGFKIIGSTKTFTQVEHALAYVYETTPGLKMMIGNLHTKLVGSFVVVEKAALALEKTTVGKACTKVGETAERMVQGATGAGRRMFGEESMANNPATGAFGRRGFEFRNAEFQSVRNAQETIDGVKYSGHALDQMQNRGVLPSIVKKHH